MEINQITKGIIGAGIEVHKVLGPGLLESAYLECMCYELSLRKMPFEREFDLPVKYKGVKLNCGYRVDILVSGLVVVELKSVSMLHPVHVAQLLTYMKLGGWKVGLLLNFNVPVLRHGIKRLVLGLEE